MEKSLDLMFSDGQPLACFCTEDSKNEMCLGENIQVVSNKAKWELKNFTERLTWEDCTKK